MFLRKSLRPSLSPSLLFPPYLPHYSSSYSSFPGGGTRRREDGGRGRKEDGGRRRDDVHAMRAQESLRYERDGLLEENLAKLKREQNKFLFDGMVECERLYLDDLNIIHIENESTFHRVPKLTHGLENVVRKPGLYSIEQIAKLQKDGGAYLRNVTYPDQIDYNRIPSYTPPSQDKLLHKFAMESNIKYVMSTSTISSVLSQLFYIFSSFKNPKFDNIFENFENEPKRYMISQRKPITILLKPIKPHSKVFAIDSDPGIFEQNNLILMELGKSLERFLTMEEHEFKSSLVKGELGENFIGEDHHRFMRLNNNICLRSQIDCQDVDPVTGKPFVFEIKTRSVCPIRYDVANYQEYLDYQILQTHGYHSSFEREYYDLIRGAFLKYAFQLKIGNMDGAFIAYHNTREIFGFEYVKTSEIEKRIFGSKNFSDVCFMVCSKLLTQLMDRILVDFKDEEYQHLKIGFYACSFTKKLMIFVELVNDEIELEEGLDYDEVKRRVLVKKSEEVRDEIDYYTKIKKLVNKVYKYECFVYQFVNGALQKNGNFEFHEGDVVEVKYSLNSCGKPSFTDYMNFLHEAYKADSLNIDLTYAGIWTK